MKKIIPITICGLLLPGIALAEQQNAKEAEPIAEKKVEEVKEAKVQIAILLDSSGSMNGLIGQARTQLWDIVNTFIDAKVDGKVPFVEVALYTHGQGAAGENNDYIRKIQTLTRDLDQVSTDLFSLTTSGSNEYCGTAIMRAANELEWDDNPNTYKAIFIAGNETFHQGSIKAKDACKIAISKGIIVNTIYCGNEAEGLKTGWQDASLLADGKFAVINQNKQIVHIDTPFDDKILKLNGELNKTYITFNKAGVVKKELQEAVDTQNAVADKKAMVNRAATKSSANYYNASWDLLDAAENKEFDWEKLKKEELPKEIQELDEEGRNAWIEKKRGERTKIQKEIQELNVQRNKFVAEKLSDKKGEGELGNAVQESVRLQAEAKGYKFEKQ